MTYSQSKGYFSTMKWRVYLSAFLLPQTHALAPPPLGGFAFSEIVDPNTIIQVVSIYKCFCLKVFLIEWLFRVRPDSPSCDYSWLSDHPFDHTNN